MVHTHAAEELVTYAVTSRKNRKGAFSVVRAARDATRRYAKHISAAVNQHAVTEEAVFSVGPPRGYIMWICAGRIGIELSSGVGSAA
jgi:hypothetical protein